MPNTGLNNLSLRQMFFCLLNIQTLFKSKFLQYKLKTNRYQFFLNNLHFGMAKAVETICKSILGLFVLSPFIVEKVDRIRNWKAFASYPKIVLE